MMLRALSYTAMSLITLCAVNVVGAQASTIPYQAVGTQNSTHYAFKADGGDVRAYYLGTGAAYDETLGLLVNGVKVASGIFQDHTTAVGSSYDFGDIAKGSTLTFFIEVQTTKQTFFSDVALNNDGANHVYSSTFAGSSKAPAGTYVGFEDLSANRSLATSQAYNVDYNYTDEQFSFTNLSLAAVPLPASAALFGVALVALGAVGRGMKRRPA